jgi:hypothetical protein
MRHTDRYGLPCCRRLTRLSKEAERDGAYRVAKRLQAVVLNAEGLTSGALAAAASTTGRHSGEWFKVGAENHWGPEKSWANLKKLYQAVDHPGFGLSIHVCDSWAGTPEEKDAADREVAPWVSHTHLDFNLTTGPRLEEKLASLWNAGYTDYYSVEHHSGKKRVHRSRHAVSQCTANSSAVPHGPEPVS